jgi:uncharacterized protein YndB with AHSA1/START domain
MMKGIKKEVFYPYPPQRVWQVLTSREALGMWLMENDFEPRVGHKFRFLYSSIPGLGKSIDCEVVELEEPRRLSFTWHDGLMCQPSIVTWTLKPVDGGTQLYLEHKIIGSVFTATKQPIHSLHVYQENYNSRKATTSNPTACLDKHLRVSTLISPKLESGYYSINQDFEPSISPILCSYFHGGWEYKVHHSLFQILMANG